MSRKRYGGNRSPYRNPSFTGVPSTGIADFEEERMFLQSSCTSGGKPLGFMILSRLSHLTESNALAKSSFRTNVGSFHLLQHCTSLSSSRWSTLR